MAKKIYIGKLPNTITEQQLSDLFSKIGKVASVKVVINRGFQQNASYGYIQMQTDEETQEAIHTLNNSVLEGNRIKVMEAHVLDQDRPPQYHYHWKKRRG